MVWTALLLSRLQFAFAVSFHIIFPCFTIGLAAWLAVLEILHLITGKPVYRRLFEFWLKIFGVTFSLGVVSGIVVAFEFAMNWSRLSEVTGPIQGPLLTHESFTAFALEASFFGLLIFGRNRVPPLVYVFSAMIVALGTTLSAFWIMVNNTWMQAAIGYAVENGIFIATDWKAIIFSPRIWVRFSTHAGRRLSDRCPLCCCNRRLVPLEREGRGRRHADAANGSVPCGDPRAGPIVLGAP